MEIDYFIATTSDEEKKKQFLALKKQFQVLCEAVESEPKDTVFDWKIYEKEFTIDKREEISQIEAFITDSLSIKYNKEAELRNLQTIANKTSMFYLKKKTELSKEYFEIRVVLQRLLLKAKVLTKDICKDLLAETEKICTEKTETLEKEKQSKENEITKKKTNLVSKALEEENIEIQKIKQRTCQTLEALEREAKESSQKNELEIQAKLVAVVDERRKAQAEISMRNRKISDIEKRIGDNTIVYRSLQNKSKEYSSFERESPEYSEYIQTGGIDSIQKNMTILSEWTSSLNTRLLFDTETDGWEKETFMSSIFGRDNLMLVNETESGDVFGCYIKKKINDNGDISDEDHFVFTLECHGRTETPQKWTKLKKMTFLKNWKIAGKMGSQEYLYIIGDSDIMIQSTVDGTCSYSFNPISNYYEGLGDDVLTGNRDVFKVKKIVALQWY
ncbi:hypothetical protein EIN_018390 [Entamoeba invadens IP1]|uniref:hypothetical protein n=1 Tax=Entamoeba invadens IP1 TaxID=370355 RepID=UPI0002C3FB62|nr:hypothetical protein EIN_018390 [Entamoeba invadens IP1]ELP90490.1 hypothetical protein EIN_018390 [Entamoeba invadens IP1]|eukprot:XP_004257261.1 hypothetical protein EIN_018390 [Entamoeba invadens IP1]